MVNNRPLLDLKHFGDICPDKNGTSSKHNFMNWRSTWGIFLVPVIAVFTKYDQFRREIMMKLEDQHRDPALLNDEMERIFSKHFLADLKGPPPFVRLESEDFVNQPTCTMLISVA
jgi:hypothetical protein